MGEVVELWEGAFVRGYRQAPGVPAFVKRVEGNGLYSIKMVGLNRGKFRVVGWKNLFRREALQRMFVGQIAGPPVPVPLYVFWKGGIRLVFLCLSLSLPLPMSPPPFSTTTLTLTPNFLPYPPPCQGILYQHFVTLCNIL